MKQTQTPVKQLLVNMNELQLLTGMRSRQTVYNKLRSDPAFPRPRRTGSHSVAFLRAEVEHWVNGLPVVELDGIDAIERRRNTGKISQELAGSTK